MWQGKKAAKQRNLAEGEEAYHDATEPINRPGLASADEPEDHVAKVSVAFKSRRKGKTQAPAVAAATATASTSQQACENQPPPADQVESQAPKVQAGASPASSEAVKAPKEAKTAVAEAVIPECWEDECDPLEGSIAASEKLERQVNEAFQAAVDQESVVVDVGAGGKYDHTRAAHYVDPILTATDAVRAAFLADNEKPKNHCRHELKKCTCLGKLKSPAYVFRHSIYNMDEDDLSNVPDGTKMLILAAIGSTVHAVSTIKDIHGGKHQIVKLRQDQRVLWQNPEPSWIMKPRPLPNGRWYCPQIVCSSRKTRVGGLVFIKATVHTWPAYEANVFTQFVLRVDALERCNKALHDEIAELKRQPPAPSSVEVSEAAVGTDSLLLSQTDLSRCDSGCTVVPVCEPSPKENAALGAPPPDGKGDETPGVSDKDERQREKEQQAYHLILGTLMCKSGAPESELITASAQAVATIGRRFHLPVDKLSEISMRAFADSARARRMLTGLVTKSRLQRYIDGETKYPYWRWTTGLTITTALAVPGLALVRMGEKQAGRTMCALSVLGLGVSTVHVMAYMRRWALVGAGVQ